MGHNSEAIQFGSWCHACFPVKTTDSTLKERKLLLTIFSATIMKSANAGENNSVSTSYEIFLKIPDYSFYANY